MTIKFSSSEIPVAYSMTQAARRLRKKKDGYHPFEKYTYYWTAFNNIYITIAYSEGKHATYRTDMNGNIITKPSGSVNIPQVNAAQEREQIKLAIDEFDDILKHQLILHDSTHFFVHRTPCWEGQPIQRDINGQRVNGVINVNYTTNSDHPVWSPIDIVAYNSSLD